MKWKNKNFSRKQILYEPLTLEKFKQIVRDITLNINTSNFDEIVGHTNTHYIFKSGTMLPMKEFDEAMKKELKNSKGIKNEIENSEIKKFEFPKLKDVKRLFSNWGKKR